MSARRRPADPEAIWQRLCAIVQDDGDLVGTLLDARKSFRELGVEAIWDKFARRLLRRLDGCGLSRVEYGKLSHALEREIEELRTCLVLNVYRAQLPAAEVAPDLVVRRVAGTVRFASLCSNLIMMYCCYRISPGPRPRSN